MFLAVCWIQMELFLGVKSVTCRFRIFFIFGIFIIYKRYKRHIKGISDAFQDLCLGRNVSCVLYLKNNLIRIHGRRRMMVHYCNVFLYVGTVLANERQLLCWSYVKNTRWRHITIIYLFSSPLFFKSCVLIFLHQGLVNVRTWTHNHCLEYWNFCGTPYCALSYRLHGFMSQINLKFT